MKFNSRHEVELIGKTGVFSYDDVMDGEPIIVSRQLSSYWIASKPLDKGISHHLKGDGFWESWVTLWVSRNVAPYSRCVNAGANYGYYTFQLAQHGCSVIAIEANPKIVPFLEKSIELNGCADRVYVINAAVADSSEGVLGLNIQESSLNSTIKDYTHTGDNYFGTIEVKKLKLDSLLAHSKKIDFIVMDIEGAEEMAWNGMQELLKANPQCVTLMEFVPVHYEQRGKLFFENMQKVCDVSYVDYDGSEKPIKNFSEILEDKAGLRMLVLRVRK